uniref:Uncharacterized protein n=1 Tax=Parastrongyloides trichosuri TaxID=131310 RepID=A0A0N4ZXM0_PARTI
MRRSRRQRRSRRSVRDGSWRGLPLDYHSSGTLCPTTLGVKWRHGHSGSSARTTRYRLRPAARMGPDGRGHQRHRATGSGVRQRTEEGRYGLPDLRPQARRRPPRGAGDSPARAGRHARQ